MNEDPEPVASTVRAYYEAVRAGESPAPFFADDETTVKVGVSEHLVGGETVAAGLREQTATTTDWALDSRALSVGRRGDTGWFTDEVRMAWTRETRDGERRHEYDTRWTGTLVRDPGGPADGRRWPFVAMHVSAARDLDAGAAADDGGE